MMIQFQQRNKYVETAIQTATPAQLLIMLCDGAIRFCKAGIEAIKQNQYEDAHHHIMRVQDILQEFVITIDQSSPLAENLMKLYDYFRFRLIEANTQKAVEPAEEVLAYLLELKETWVNAAIAAKNPNKEAQHG